MMTIDEIRSELEDSNIQKVADKAGVSAALCYRIVNGFNNPGYEAIEKLSTYLESKKCK